MRNDTLYLNCIAISGIALGRQWSQDLNQNFKPGEDFRTVYTAGVGFSVLWGVFCLVFKKSIQYS